ncbi:MAG: transglycosylase domain-containing protein, partial [Christensenellaceae bacterium]
AGEGGPARQRQPAQPAGKPSRSAEGHEPERRARRRTLEEPQVSPLFVFRSKPKPRNFVLSVIVTTLKLFAVLILVGGISGLGFGLGIAQAYVATTPDLDITQIEDQSETSFIYDMDGNLITMYTGVENRIWATKEEMPQMLLDAIVSIEDERFYSHSGVDIKRIIGALFSNMRSSTTQGGSTITQQLIKMRVLSSEQTYKRKLQEAYLAIQLEKEYSKDEILVAYLNTINLAQSNYGVKAAAEDYFGKELSELSLRECAMLAGCAQAPYTYDPRSNFYTRDRAEVTNKRTDLVLAAMYKNNKITKEQYEQALNDTLVILEKSPRTQKYDYPYFVEYAVQDVITHLLRDRGLPDNDTNRSQIESEIRTSGYHIY